MKNTNKVILAFLALLLLNACATYKLQYDEEANKPVSSKEIAHSFYLVGDAGNSPLGSQTEALKQLVLELNIASDNSTLLFLGDNIYPNGLPKKEEEGRAFAEHQLNTQIEARTNFKGRTIFIPGNHDWYANGLKGLKRQEKYVEDRVGKNSFLPENGCPLKKVDISDSIQLIIVDSQWYLADWDKHPTINDNCEIRTRSKFFDELEGLIKKARGKTTLIALHHPMFSNGPHGGQYSFGQHMTPIPVLGTLKNILRKASGISPQDLQNKRYNTFKKRVVTLSQENDKVIFVSGHEHSLQYIIQDNLPQIISGTGSKVNPTRNVGGGQFSYGSQGFARLDVYTDGSSGVRFYSAADGKVVFQTEVLPKDIKGKTTIKNPNFPSHKSASIYTSEETDKGGIYKALWGDRYRKYYGTAVNAPTVNLDTLFGGLTPVRKGGGHQSKSLRLRDSEGREYVMRALRKNALQYLQAVAFKDQYIEGQFDDTYTEGLLLDVFTGSHPYAPFTIGALSDAVGVYHTNPVLYYIPKQPRLGQFNDEFGEELYMIEERAASGHGDKESFGFSNKVISTDDLLKKLAKSENHQLDEGAYIRARLFDMLIGDWDRHEDQWRWASFKEDGKTIYRPIPRDRDQAFSIMADGALLNVATRIVPSLRLMHSYAEELRSPKWFNLEPYPLDMALINESNRAIWNAQVTRIQTNLTDEVIKDAFSNFPKEVMDETIQEIQRKLVGRRANLQKISDTYYNHINKFAIIRGTDKDDWFEIERMPQGETKVTGYRIKKGEKGTIFHERTYTCDDTKEIWMYGLDDEDQFHVSGTGDNYIKIRIIGGQNKDTYHIENGKKIKMYDFKSKKNDFVTNKGSKKLTDDYETNVYDYKKLKYNSNQLIPSIGSNPDDGFKIGFVDTYTTYGFERNPFTAQHSLLAAYYFATQGFDLEYKGEFAYVLGCLNLGISAGYTSSNYSINFFGFGNTTPNLNVDDEDNFDLDYNRVKLSTLQFSPSLLWKGELGAEIELGLSYESVEVEKTAERFINTFYTFTNTDTRNNFAGVEASYHFKNSDNEAFPTLGMDVNLQVGYKANVDNSKGFGYIIPSLGIDYKLIPSGQLVLATKVKGHVNVGDDFEFYQAASLGANDGLRGYRNQRFTGKNAFYQNTDIRLNLRKVKTGLLPLNIGIYGGVDYGRIWVDDDLVLNNSFNNDTWNTSFGGGIFANAADMITANISAFNSDDGLRLAFALGFGF